MILTRLAFVLASCLLLTAAGSHPAPDAAAVVRAIEARYQSVRTLQATFLQRYSEGREDVRIESGKAFFSRPGRMRWEYEEPEEKLFLVDGKTVWFYVPADRTVTRAKIKESADWQTPIALLVGKFRISRVCGRVELVQPQAGPAGAPAGHTVLRCVPRSRDAGFSEVLIEVDASYWLTRVLVREPAGVETEFRFANWQRDIPLPEAIFHFQAPPGVAIVDEASIAGPIRP
jgi:outer membrane lipoprotein carrier protein